MNAQEFTTKIEQGISEKVAKRDFFSDATELWMDDADIDRDQAREALDMIFTAKSFYNGMYLIKSFPDDYSDMTPEEASYKFAKGMINKDYTWNNAVSDNVNMAMTYYVADNWKSYWEICQVFFADKKWFSKDVFGKTVGYLYDQYACEEA